MCCKNISSKLIINHYRLKLETSLKKGGCFFSPWQIALELTNRFKKTRYGYFLIGCAKLSISICSENLDLKRGLFRKLCLKICIHLRFRSRRRRAIILYSNNANMFVISNIYCTSFIAPSTARKSDCFDKESNSGHHVACTFRLNETQTLNIVIKDRERPLSALNLCRPGLKIIFTMLSTKLLTQAHSD